MYTIYELSSPPSCQLLLSPLATGNEPVMRRHRLLFLITLFALLVSIARPAGPPARASSWPISRFDQSSPFGVVANLAVNVRRDEHKAMVDLMREAGVQWHREDFSWERLQPQRGGPYRWGGDGYGFLNYDDAVTRLRTSGLQIVGLLAYNPAWLKSKTAPLDDWIGDWEKFVRAVVSRYGRERGEIKHWEIWNEPNLRMYGYENGLYTIDHYARLLSVTRRAITEADPQAVIVLGGLASVWSEVPEHFHDTFDYLELLGAAGAWDSFDVLNLHAYRPGPPEGRFQRRERTMDFADEMQELDMLMQRFGAKPIWFTETGWGSHQGPYGITEEEQAYYLVRWYALALQYPNVEKIFWYNFRNNLAYWTPYDNLLFDESVPDWHMGLIRRTYPLNPDAPTLRKPAFAAYRTMTNLLGGLDRIATLATGNRADLPGVYWYRYGKDERGVELLWNLNASPTTITLPCPCTEARLRHWNGALARIVTSDTGDLRVTLPPHGEPIYLEYGPDRHTSTRYFAETGHGIGGVFRQYWERNGGLAQFGYPITGELIEPDPNTGKARVVQYFERNRFEYFPEHAGTPYLVQIGRLGDDQLRQQGIRWQNLPPAASTRRECRRFAETQRMLCPPFRAYWEQRGGLSMYGMPLTDAYIVNGRLVQYFERNRFEYHPENAGTPYDVLLGLLGVELFANP